MSVVGAASSPDLGAPQGCLQECPSFLCVVIAIPPPLILLISLDMGSDIWVRPLCPIAPQGVACMLFANVTKALRYLRSEDGGSLRIQHTQVARATKAHATRDGYTFTFEEPSSQVVASSPRSQRTTTAPTPNLSTFGFTSVRCACCNANICGTKHTCSRCHRVVDEACMQLVQRLVQCFSCTRRACGNELASHTVECHACHFRVHPTCTNDGVCTLCAAREPRRLTLFLRHVSSPLHGS